ncbi:hypothetical protein C8R46DRAFT_366164 [Mycena filopes]|nr:hypothetical protein C8R46DRAFT_366164 [Mycena filopes]
MRLRRLLAASVSYPCPFTSLVSSTMASSPNSAALILFHPHTLVKRSEERDQGKNWALTLSGFTLSPGRTLDRVYTVWGHALEKQANRVAHKIGLGPHATTQKLKVFFGDGEQRLLKLENLRTCTPSRVHNYCANLTKYTLSTEGLTTRLRAFKNIVHLCTQFLGLRRIFLGCKYMQGATSAASISQLWDPSLTVPNEEWSFWQGLAAACLSETTVSTLLEDTPLLEGTPLAKLTYCPDEGLSVIERLLVEWNCSADCTFSAALCVRYLGGILDLPGFWAEMGAVQSLVAEKLCREMVRALKDIGVYVLQLGLLGEADPPFDYDGLDLLSATMLVGLSSWFKKLNEQERPLQPWYHPLREVLRLLRAPRSLDLLPQAAAYAVGIWETLLPLRSTIAEVDVTARCEDGDGSGDEITIVDLSPDAPLASVTGTLLGGSDHVNEDDSVPTPESNDGEPATEPHTSEESGSTDPPPELSTLEEPGSEDAPMDEVDIDPTRAHAEQSEPRKDSAAQDPREASVTATDSMINNLENTDTREDSADARGDLFDPTLDHPDRPEILQDSLKAWENSERSSSPPALDDVNEKQATSDAAEDSGGHIEQSNRETNQADEAAGEEKSDAQSASAAASHCNENQELESSLNSGHEEIAPSVTNSDTQAEPGVGVEIGHNKSRDVKPGTILNRSEDSGPVHVVDVVPGIGSDGTPTAQGENSTETAGLASRPNAVLVPSQVLFTLTPRALGS